MKTEILTLNAKYIHTSLAVRLLYLAAQKSFDVFFREFVIKDDAGHIAGEILASGCDVAAFSCYIWNIEKTLEVCALLKREKPETVIILGGPEVTYDAVQFINNPCIDYIIRGEGEDVFPLLLSDIEKGIPSKLEGVVSKTHGSDTVLTCPLSQVEALGSPYTLPGDKASAGKRVLYFESSRGCPHRCSYCLSSLENGMRFFSEDYLKTQLKAVCESGVKTVKFLDRSFSTNAKHALFVLDTIIKYHREGQQFQFEINADTLPDAVLDYIVMNAPRKLFRFEVGIQSTYEPSNLAVNRRQDFKKIVKVVNTLIAGGKCDLHLDLIAGLPYEDYERFKITFNEVYALGGKELQLGFLKLLRGTSLRTSADDFGYCYQDRAPYEIQCSRWLSARDIEKIHIVEDMLEKYHNSGRFSRTIREIAAVTPDMFDFFLSLGYYFHKQRYKDIGYQLYELFDCLDKFTVGSYHAALLADYYPLFHSRPKRWFPAPYIGAEKKRILHAIADTNRLDPEQLFRYATLEDAGNAYMLILYSGGCQITYYKKDDFSQIKEDI